jgi:hypothetical protein
MSNMSTKTIPIASIRIGDRHRKDMGDLDGLARSIQEHGLLHPVVLDEDSKLVAGERRLRACKDILRLKDIPARILNIADALKAERDENECRKNLTHTERLAIAQEIERRIGDRQGQRTDKELVAPGPQVELPAPGPEVGPGDKTADIAAKASGLGSRKTMERVETVVVNGIPELIEAMDAGAIGVKPAAAIADLPPEEQRKAVKRKTQAVQCRDCRMKRRQKKNCKDCKAARAAAKAETNGHVEPTAAEPPPTPATDTLSIPIQDHARTAFEAVPLFDELLKVLRQADKLYSQLAEHPGGAYLLWPGISINARDRWKHAGIKTAILNVTDCKPSLTVCPYAFNEHHKHGDDCNLCHGLNWTRPLGKEEVPESMLKAAKRHFGVKG